MARKYQSEYAKKLKDPRWQRMRLEIMERDDWTCQNCGATDATFNVHHRMYFYGRDPWDYPPELLVTLCEDCHDCETPAAKAAWERLKVALSSRGAYSYGIDHLAQWIEQFPEDGPDINDVAIALQGFADGPLTDSIVKAWNECGPWNDGEVPTVVFTSAVATAAPPNRRAVSIAATDSPTEAPLDQ